MLGKFFCEVGAPLVQLGSAQTWRCCHVLAFFQDRPVLGLLGYQLGFADTRLLGSGVVVRSVEDVCEAAVRTRSMAVFARDVLFGGQDKIRNVTSPFVFSCAL